jgi:hypothetical protein
MDQALLMSLLAARNGGALPTGADGAVDPAALDPQAVLQRLSATNPTVAAIMQMMEAQRAAAASREPVVVEGVAEVVTGTDPADLAAQLDAALAEVQLLRERCDTLAAAVGACGLCWGQDPSCRACRGHGAPGRCIPDEQLFFEFVVPAVRLMHASRKRSNDVAPPADSTPMRLTS